MAVTRHAHTRRARELVLGGIVALLGAGTLGCGDVGDACRDCGTPDAARTDAGAMDRESGANVDASSGVDGGSDVDGGGSGVDAGPSIDCTRDVTADATGASDVTSALQSFIDASPDGSVICFEAGGQYRVDGTIHVSGRSSLIFAGRGARIFQTVRATTRIWLIDGGGSDITMRDLTVEGANPNPGKWDVAYEHNHAIQIGGTLRVELAHLTIKNIGGDGLYVSGGADRWADSVHLHDSLLDGIGRMGVAITDGGSNVVVDFNTFQRIGYYTWDLEPNGATVGGRLAGAEHVRFSDNRIETKPFGDYPTDPTQADGLLFAVTGASGGGPAIDVEISRNVMTDPTWGTLRIGVFSGGERRDIRVVGNTTATRAPGPVMSFNGVDGLTVTDNTQPLSSGSLVETSGCTSVSISDNTTL